MSKHIIIMLLFCINYLSGMNNQDPHRLLAYETDSPERIHGHRIEFITIYYSYCNPLDDYIRPRLLLIKHLHTLIDKDRLQENNIQTGTIDLTDHIQCTIILVGKDNSFNFSYNRATLLQELEKRKREMIER